MVEEFLIQFKTIFLKCAEWTSALFDSVGGKGVVLAAFFIVLAITLLVLPIRGRGIDVSFEDFTKSVTFKRRSRTKEKGLVVSNRRTDVTKH